MHTETFHHVEQHSNIVQPEPWAASPETSRRRADELIRWVRDYAERRINSRLIDERRCIPPHVILDFGNRGLLGMQVPERFGGLGLRCGDALRVLEQLSAIDLTLAIVVLDSILGAHTIGHHATEAVRGEFLPLVARGRVFAAVAMTEPKAGSNLRAIETRAVPEGRGAWRLHGSKLWVGAGSAASVIHVYAQLLDERGRSRGLTGFIVRQGADGLHIGPEALTLGLRGFTKNTVVLDGVRVTTADMLGAPGSGMEGARDTMMLIRFYLGGMAVGGMKRCAQLMLRYAERRQVLTGNLLDNPVTLARMSELAARITSVEALATRIAELRDAGRSVPAEAYMACKNAGAESLGWAVDQLVQLLGARGYEESNLVPQMYRDARPWRIFEGPTEALNMVLGSSALHTDRSLYRFLAETCASPAIARRLEEAAARVRARAGNAATPFDDRSTALYWGSALLGDAATDALLLAAVESSRGDASALRPAAAWLGGRFDAALAAACDGAREEAALMSRDALTLRISRYAAAVGDVEQGLPGASDALDPYLSRRFEEDLAYWTPPSRARRAQAPRTTLAAPAGDLWPGGARPARTGGNGAAHPCGAPDDAACVHDLFARAAARAPGAIAVVSGARSITYAELDARSNQLAHHLAALGVGREALVGVCVERSIEQIVAMLAVLKAGGAYVPIDPAEPEPRRAYILKDAGVVTVLTSEALACRVASQAAHVVCLDADRTAIEARPTAAPAAAAGLGQAAYVIYTSGSTGQPKGVVVEHAALSRFTRSACVEYGIGPGDRVLQFAAISFDAAVEEIYTSLISGGTLVLRSEAMIGSAPALVAACAELGLTVLDLPTGYWHQLTAELTASGLKLPPCVRLVIIGGERASLARVLAWKAHCGPSPRLVNTYGPTEATVVAITCDLSAVDDLGAEVPIGRPMPHVEAHVLGPASEPVPGGVAGELYLGGAGLARGYHGRPDLTAERFITSPFDPSGHARLYRTGDLVRWRADGHLEFVGRADHQVKIRGYRVEPEEIEAILAESPLVGDAAVVAPEHADGSRRLVAFVVPRTPSSNLPQELRGFLASRLPAYMIPSAFHAMDCLPRTVSRKLDRQALLSRASLPAELAPAGDPGIDPADLPRTATERALAAIWKEVLGAEVGIHDNFLDVGGNSLLAIQTAARIRSALGVELSVDALFSAPSIAELAEHIDAKHALREEGAGSQLAARPADDATALAAPQHELPLSPGQEQIWFLHRLHAGEPLYNEPCAIRMRGPVDEGVLERCLVELIRRHEILRTAFVEREGRPVRIVRTPSFSLRVVDLRAVPPADRAPAAQRLAEEQARLSFDLGAPPLLRATFVRLADDEQELHLVLHHLIVDGISLYRVLLAELEVAYDALSRGATAPPWPELPAQYADFVAYQRAEAERAAKVELPWWIERLRGLPELELPLDRPRPSAPRCSGERACMAFSSDLTEALRRLGRREGVTLFMTVTAAIYVLLHRYTGQRDLALGTVIAQRGRPELERVMGYCDNTLVLRADLSGDPTVGELLRRVRGLSLEALQHQALPFEALVAALHPRRHAGRNPLFQVAFISQPPLAAGPLGWTLDRLGVHTGTAKFDLMIEIDERAEGILGRIEYRSDLLAAETVRRMAGHLEVLLAAMAEDPARRISALPVLTPGERRQLLDDWNATAIERPSCSIVAPFEAQVRRTPDAAAVVFGAEELTYDALNRRANQLARRLRRLGVRRDTGVALLLDRTPELIVGVLGILKAGAAYVPLDLSYPAERLRFMCADAGVRVLVTRAGLLHLLPDHGAEALCMDAAQDLLSAEPDHDLDDDASPEQLAYVLYTSGSTGTPKGVAMPQGPLVNLLAWQLRQTALGSGDRTLQFAPISFDASFLELFATFWAGGTLVLISEPARRDPLALLGVIADHRVARMFLPFVALQQMAVAVDRGAPAPESLRELYVAGEQLRITPAVRRFFEKLPHCVLQNQYGPSETHVVTALTLSGPVSAWPELPSIGRPIDNTQIYLLDPAGHPVPIGVPGELYVGGAALARGYLGRPELTAERFLVDPFSAAPDARLYRTGDLARYLPDGNIAFLGRTDAQVKIRGFRVELDEVEAVLARHPGVEAAAVAARDDATGGKRLVGYVVPRDGCDVGDLREFMRATVPDYMVPAVIVPLSSLPLTPSGKADRRALPEPEGLTAPTGRAWVAPRDEIELRLARIWSEVLRVNPVGATDDFFDLGGHSLLATLLTARIEQEFGQAFPLAALFGGSTVERVASALRAPARARPWTPLVPIQPNGGRPPFFCVAGSGGNVVYFHALARHLGADQPFYGLQYPGIDGQSPPLATIEALAAHHLAAIRAFRPHGPYALGGHSVGGAIAFEMARQLEREGEQVALLAILDVPAPVAESDWIGFRWDHARWLTAILALFEPMSSEALRSLDEELRARSPEAQLELLARRLGAAGVLPTDAGPDRARGIAEVMKASDLAYGRYDPAHVTVDRIVLLRASEPSRFDPLVDLGLFARAADDPAWGWGKHARAGVDIRWVPGDHMTMFAEPHARAVAQVLAQSLEAAASTAGRPA
ncbi:hypothetical protein BE21_55215 [Sorangium cellulosum]|uniref:Carrier domain-containing protein n=1 Tax=Sorangium cellulosum TaxID=56 RepID=A0A150TBX4_SORCE|nr:hypothetical protein BE21_55215 [Sorangium cellulosum]